MMGSQRVWLTSNSCRRNLRFVLAAAVTAMLVLDYSAPAFACQAPGSDSNAGPSGQSAPPSGSSAQAQPPVFSKSQVPTPVPASSKQQLYCKHAANPNKRHFGCKDEEYDWDETLTADWDGAREEARKLGIVPSVSYYSALQTNATGGSHQTWGYVGQLTTAVDFNFEKLFKIPGMSLYFSDSWGTGSNLSADIGAVFPVNADYAVGAYLGEIYLQQKLLKDKLTLAAGRLAANYTFAGLPVYENYVCYAIDPTPSSMLANDYSYGGPPPGLEWGAQALYNITPVVQVAAGIFNTNLNSENNGNNFAFQQGNKGALVTAQASYLYNQGLHDKAMPGQYTAGFFKDNNAFATLPNGSLKSDGNAGLFILGQQMVYRPEGPGTSQGLTIWGAYTYSSKQLVSSMPIFGGVGLSYEGLIKQRKQDIVSLGWVYGKTSKFIPTASSAKLLEVNYQWVPKRYINVIPDFQYIWNPTGTNSAPTAVFGVQLTVTF